MPATFEHVQFNVGIPETSLAFYKEMFTFLGFQILFEHEGELVAVSDGHMRFYFYRTDEDKRSYRYDRDATGINHVGVMVESKEAVDSFISDFMRPHGIEPAWGTPRTREDYGDNYYQVMFPDGEGLGIEVFYRDA